MLFVMTFPRLAVRNQGELQQTLQLFTKLPDLPRVCHVTHLKAWLEVWKSCCELLHLATSPQQHQRQHNKFARAIFPLLTSILHVFDSNDYKEELNVEHGVLPLLLCNAPDR